MKAIVASLMTALACVSLASARDTRGDSARAGLVPACPQASYGADGNMSPLFCVVDNPAALAYYGKGARHLFALGPSATPVQVARALEKDAKTLVTLPFICSAYRLAAWREHWSFGEPPTNQIAQARNMPPGWCQTPDFKVR